MRQRHSYREAARGEHGSRVGLELTMGIDPVLGFDGFWFHFFGIGLVRFDSRFLGRN